MLSYSSIKEENGSQGTFIKPIEAEHGLGLYFFLLKKKTIRTLRNTVTPLLVFTFVLPFFFTDIFAKDNKTSPVLEIALLLFLQINSVFINFAIRNYYGGKKVLRTWFIQLIIISIAVYFLV